MNNLFNADKLEIFSEPLIGVVEEAIAPQQPGRISFQGSYWPAKLYQSNSPIILSPEKAVKVVGIQGITLLVQPF
ncbi:NfeD family protein [Kamptonema sp. UHCC 0994]|uniref:NfeD family protein n=1 Tax=Kamptonema sp. UHCC 0994 TaxID=3031329 RepID=UPI0023B8BCFD|nr:NfeD family protein [Kamptonema sp. UHCC 0994]MDF0555598.1 NfeD family protein [Kamptonema sp. UHCC 0994]